MPDIVIAPADILDEALPDCDPSSEEAQTTAAQLMEVMRTTPHAAAVAANQIGSRMRMLAYWSRQREVTILANPRIVKQSKNGRFANEGCLSFPDTVFRVHRPNKVVVSCAGQDGTTGHIQAHGFEARVLCHEIDHLDGILVPSRAVGSARR